MKKIIPLSFVMAIVCLWQFPAFSQQDSVYLDLGRTKLNKESVQHITVKGSDLEKMPFAGLTEALRVWFNGDFNFAASTLYVIDGVFITDANSISIYNIEEVTLVQNALALTNGSARQKHLVLIKTRKNYPGKNGLAMAAQTYLVKSNFRNQLQGNKQSSETGFYHQYQLTAWHNGKNVQAGLSANYLRDVFPNPKNDTITTHTPFNFDRFRLNGRITARIGNSHSLTLKMNYVPDITDGAEESRVPAYSTNTASAKGRNTVINPTLHFRSALSKKWTNEIKASFLTLKGREHNRYINNYFFGLQDTFETNQNVNTNLTNLLVQNHLSYRTGFGNWTFEPSIIFQFRYLKHNTESYYSRKQINSLVSNSSYSITSAKGNLFLLTPSLHLYNRNIFYLQAGVLANVSKVKGYNSKRIFPFASASLDMLKLFNPQNTYSLQLFGSYAQADDYGEQPVQLPDYSNSYSSFINFATPQSVVTSPYPVLPNPGYSTVNKFLQAGSQFSFPDGKGTIRYNYDNREYYDQTLVIIPIGAGGGGAALVSILIKSRYHRVGLTGKILNSGNFEWASGINTTTAKTKVEFSGSGITPVYGGGLLNSSNAFTGGWTNRFRFKNFLAGADLLYIIDESRQTGFATFEKVNSFLLQNVYFGYSWQSTRLKNIELYASFKNPWQNENSYLADDRKYIGLGFKAQL